MKETIHPATRQQMSSDDRYAKYMAGREKLDREEHPVDTALRVLDFVCETAADDPESVIGPEYAQRCRDKLADWWTTHGELEVTVARLRAERDALEAQFHLIRSLRPPSGGECDAAAAAAAAGADEVFVDGWTYRRCRHCDEWVGGGPTACERCVVQAELAEAVAALDKTEALRLAALSQRDVVKLREKAEVERDEAMAFARDLDEKRTDAFERLRRERDEARDELIEAKQLHRALARAEKARLILHWCRGRLACVNDAEGSRQLTAIMDAGEADDD